MKALTESQTRDLREIATGHIRGFHRGTCESLCRMGLISGDWDTGYYVTDRGASLPACAGTLAAESWRNWRVHAAR